MAKNKSKKKKRRDSTSITYGGMMAGGYYNSMTGAGGSFDKTEYSYFLPTRITGRMEMETLYAQSWAAAKFIDIPVDDMFLRWREFSDMSKEAVERIEELEDQFDIQDRLSRAMKAGRLYGTGMVIILTREAPPEVPLNINRIIPGDLQNLLTVDRFDCSVMSKDWNPLSQNYGKPSMYRVILKNGQSMHVHHTRVLRFDGIDPLSMTGWQQYDEDWGVPSILPVAVEIMTDAGASKGAAHLINEVSVPYQKVEDFADAVQGGEDCEMSIVDRMEAVTLGRSIYRTIFMDSKDEFGRVDIAFGGLPEMMDRFARRLAAAADIPMTRFWGQSPLGMNATGESDIKNYAMSVDTLKNKQLKRPLFLLDNILSRHGGITEPINYEFPSLIDVSDTEQSTVLAQKSTSLTQLVMSGLINEQEARAALDGDPILGNLDMSQDLLPEVKEFQKRAEQKAQEIEQQAMEDSKKPWFKFWSK